MSALLLVLQKGGSETKPGGDGWVQTEAGPICETTNFEIIGDATVDKVCSWAMSIDHHQVLGFRPMIAIAFN